MPDPRISQISRRVENLTRARAFWRDSLQIPELYALRAWPSLTCPAPA